VRTQRVDSRSTSAASSGIPSVSVVIPTLNEAKNLPHVLPLIPDWVSEVVIVDGLSVDNTVEVALECIPSAQIVRVAERGKGAAMRAGFTAASGEIIVTLDADGSTDPAEIPAFVGLLLAGADIALGSRFATGGGSSDMELTRRAGNWVLAQCVRAAFGTNYSDLCYGYFAFWNDVLPYIDGPFTGFEVETVVHIRAVRAGLKIAEVPSFEAERIWGTSNLNTFRDGMRVLTAIGREWLLHRREPEPVSIDLVREERRRTLTIPPWLDASEQANREIVQ
jgi:glycosyltransferase involved in cell wall biosynthesis